MRTPNKRAIDATRKAVNAQRATLSRNKLSPTGSGVETASRNTGQTDLGRVKGGRHAT